MHREVCCTDKISICSCFFLLIWMSLANFRYRCLSFSMNAKCSERTKSTTFFISLVFSFLNDIVCLSTMEQLARIPLHTMAAHKRKHQIEYIISNVFYRFLLLFRSQPFSIFFLFAFFFFFWSETNDESTWRRRRQKMKWKTFSSDFW